LAAAFGILFGMLMARSTAVHWLLDPLVALGFPSPKIAFLPVFILWFGIESVSKILLVGFACVLPVIIGTFSAARAVNRVLLWSAFSLGTSQQALLVHIILPACYPRIFATLRIALPVALITTFTAEMVAGGGGMGATLVYSQRFFESQRGSHTFWLCSESASFSMRQCGYFSGTTWLGRRITEPNDLNVDAYQDEIAAIASKSAVRHLLSIVYSLARPHRQSPLAVHCSTPLNRCTAFIKLIRCLCAPVSAHRRCNNCQPARRAWEEH